MTDITDIEKLLTVANKRDMRQAINHWITDEITSEARAIASTLVKQWIKEHRAELIQAVDAEMRKAIPKLVNTLVDRCSRNY